MCHFYFRYNCFVIDYQLVLVTIIFCQLYYYFCWSMTLLSLCWLVCRPYHYLCFVSRQSRSIVLFISFGTHEYCALHHQQIITVALIMVPPVLFWLLFLLLLSLNYSIVFCCCTYYYIILIIVIVNALFLIAAKNNTVIAFQIILYLWLPFDQYQFIIHFIPIINTNCYFPQCTCISIVNDDYILLLILLVLLLLLHVAWLWWNSVACSSIETKKKIKNPMIFAMLSNQLQYNTICIG